MYIFGIAIFIFGLAFLLRNLGVLYFPGSFWSIFYPLVIIIVGLTIVCVTYEGKKLLKKIKELLTWADKVE